MIPCQIKNFTSHKVYSMMSFIISLLNMKALASPNKIYIVWMHTL